MRLGKGRPPARLMKARNGERVLAGLEDLGGTLEFTAEAIRDDYTELGSVLLDIGTLRF